MRYVNFFAVATLSTVFLTGCGGGGDTTQAVIPPAFTSADFSGKSVYYVSSAAYSLGTFDANGTALASNMITTGVPVLNSTSAQWTVSNGELLITFQGLTQRYTLMSVDAANRYYKVTKHSDNGTISTIGMFYGQVTGLSQAQNFVTTHQVP